MDERKLDIEVGERCREGFDRLRFHILVFFEALMEDKPDAIPRLPPESAAEFRDRLLQRVRQGFQVLLCGYFPRVVREQILTVPAKHRRYAYDPFAGSTAAVGQASASD